MNATMQRTDLIESKIDKAIATQLEVKDGGLSIRDMGQVMEFSKLMAVSGQAVPQHCRNQVGVCLAIIVQSIEWRMSPFAVANKSYVVNDRVSYESQLIHAVIEQRAPITSRLRHSFSGAGDSRRCKVWATAKGEPDPLVYESPEFKTIQPKNSPLWKTKPDLQLFYNTSRDWARMYFPDVIMGVYSQDEMLDCEPIKPRPTLASLTERITSETPIIDAQPEQEPPREQAPSTFADCVNLNQIDAMEQQLLAETDDPEKWEQIKADAHFRREDLNQKGKEG